MTQVQLESANCPSCGVIFRINARGICQNCIVSVEMEISSCAQLLKKERKLTVVELSEKTGVPVQKIITFIRDNKLIIADYPNINYACDLCGNGIRKGSLCIPCKTRINTDITKLHERESNEKAKLIKENQSSYRINDRAR